MGISPKVDNLIYPLIGQYEGDELFSHTWVLRPYTVV